MLDLSPREILVMAPLVAATLWMGIYPEPILNATSASVERLIEQHQASLGVAARALAALN
jgi:NADH-quinone oxidoreductase subunit M